MTLFRLDSSLRSEGSVSRRLADVVEASWLERRPGAPVVRRDVGVEPVPAAAWSQAVAAGFTPAAERSPEQVDALALAAGLVDELERAEAYLFAVPLYNFGIPSSLKVWIDLLITDPRLAPGGSRPLAGRPAVLAVARGGAYGPGTPRDGWDHGTPWARRILGDVFGLDLHVVEAELTLAPVMPALAELRPLGEASLARALDDAAGLGKRLADLTARPSAA